MTALQSARFNQQVLHLHEFGPRAGADFLMGLGRQSDCGPAMRLLLAQYRRLTPAILRAVGGDRFYTCPLRTVPVDLDGRAA